MASSYLKLTDPEALVQCPYNDCHMVRNKRMQYHIIDCRRQYIGSDMKTCPYNAKHVHPSVEHQYHIVHCPDRTLVDREILFAQSEGQELVRQSGCTQVPPYSNPVQAAVTEDWDSEANGEPFSLNDALQVKRIPTAAVEVAEKEKVRLPRAEPDVLKINELRQPRQATASLDSVGVTASVPLAFSAENHQPVMNTSVAFPSSVFSSSVGYGRGQQLLAVMQETAKPGSKQSSNAQLLPSFARGKLLPLLSTVPAGVNGASLLMMNGIGRGQNRVSTTAATPDSSITSSHVEPVVTSAAVFSNYHWWQNTDIPASALTSNGYGRGNGLAPPQSIKCS